MNCKIKNIKIKNYKSIDSVSINPHDSLSVFIGKNGSGKTVFLTAVMLLKKLYDNRLYPTYIHNLKKLEEEQKNISTLKVTFIVDDCELIYTAKFYKNEESERHLINEFETIDEFWQVKKKRISKRKLKVPLALFLDMTKEERHSVVRLRGFRLNVSEANKQDLTYMKKYTKYFETVAKYIRGMKYYSAIKFANSSSCDSYLELSGKKNNRLRSYHRNKANSRFLFDLYNAYSEDKELYNVYKNIVCDKRLELIDKIDFKVHEMPSYDIKVRSGGKVVKSKEARKIICPFFFKGSYKLSPSHLSEGTFKTLALLFYIISDKGSALLIEEPEVCVHHGLLDNIIDVIKSYSSNKQIFVSTHSECVLDNVDPENIFVVHWQTNTKIKSLKLFLGQKGISSLKTYLTSSGNLGEYIRHKEILDE